MEEEITIIEQYLKRISTDKKLSRALLVSIDVIDSFGNVRDGYKILEEK